MRFSVGSLANSGGLRSRIGAIFEAAATAILVLLALTASAMGEGAKPFRAARLTYIEGQVRVEQANRTANSAAVVNMPLVEGTVISSGVDGEAEIEFEDGSLARITPNSGLSLLNLSIDSSGTYQTRVALLGGLAYFELRAGTKYVYSVDAGGDVISPIENATVRVNLDEPPASISVLDGSAHVAGAGGANVDANAGQTVRNESGSGSGEALYTVKSAIAPESWDRWNEDRDEAAADEAGSETGARSKFAGSQGYGWSDLDANGSWYDVPGSGQVWQPDLAAPNPDDSGGADQETADASSFDPYGYGSWAWTPAGYSWASGYAWGWLPYRCGQWSYFDGFGWGWSPSPYCGVYGFGGYGYGGYGFNFGNLPPGYRRPHVPIQGPGPIHPILRGRGGRVPPQPVHRPGGERVIAGVTVQPLQPIGTGFVAGGGGALGAALRRDYPVDTKTQAPLLGLVAEHGSPGTILNARPAYPPRQAYNGQGVQPARGSYQQRGPQPQGAASQYQGGGRPAPVQRQSSPAAPRYSPPAQSAPVSHSAPASAPSSSKGK